LCCNISSKKEDITLKGSLLSSRGAEFGAKRKYHPQQAATGVQMKKQGKSLTITKAMCFTTGKVGSILSNKGVA
tara:strand:+ start:333 stop:554 length:222 start_codon:yes stop_codon:yes gene_type:complete